MAINDTFNILPKIKVSLEADLKSYLPKQKYSEECKESIPLKKDVFSIGSKVYFLYLKL